MLDYRIPLGPFELHRSIGQGAAGEVWRGVHVAQSFPVAVKVITASNARDPAVRAAFHNEVRAVARLHHPGIVHVLDYGVVTSEAEHASEGCLIAGSPYLAMEVISGGTLPRPRVPMAWASLRAMLLELLDALAHAHARGVVHRDIKPGNILIATAADSRPGLKLTDFGIARAVGLSDTTAGTISGTPHYMAPEQILDQTRDHGPWTDLYALGCLAYQFAQGANIFPHAGAAELLRSQVFVDPPPIEGRRVPAGFQGWLNRMLAKRPSDRFQLAAEAAWALAQLGDAPPDPDQAARATGALELPGVLVASLEPHHESSDTIRVARTSRVDAPGVEAQPRELATLAEIFSTPVETPSSGGTRVTTAQPTPPTWRRKSQPTASLRLVGAGLGLFGLRTVPLADREDERDILWSALQAVAATGRASCVVLRGGAGYGKSRLVEWTSQRAHELGAAHVLYATHSPITERSGGLGPMVAQELRCIDLDRTSALARAAAFVEQRPLPQRNLDDALALVELMAPPEADIDLPGDTPRVHFTTPGERHGVVLRFLRRLCLPRPCIVWLDDVQWGADSLAFAAFLMELQAVFPVPVLLLATVRDDALVDRPIETGLLAELVRCEGVHEMEIGPLPPAHHRALVEDLLSLEPSLARDVAERTGGNPLFAIQLVGDWVSRGVLVMGKAGFRLRPGESGLVPDDIHGLWLARTRQILADGPAGEASWRALEVAAALGKDLQVAEWVAACRHAGVEVPENLVETMLGHRLWTTSAVGLSFAHGMLRESVWRAAAESGRLPACHTACAQMLERMYPADAPLVAERRAEHLMLAGDVDAALEPMGRAADARAKRADYRVALDIFQRREGAMHEIGLDARDPRWVLGWLLQLRAHLSQGSIDQASVLAQRARDALGRYVLPRRVAALTARETGHLLYRKGDTAGATAQFRAALKLFVGLDEPAAEGDCLLGLGYALRFMHALDEAEDCLLRVITLHSRNHDFQLLGMALKVLANVYQARHDHDTAERHLRRAMEIFETHGYHQDLAACLNDLGETARGRGLLDEAEQFYRRSGELYEALGSMAATTPWFNLAFVRITRGDYAVAGGVLAAQRARLEPLGDCLDLIWIYTGLLPCAAASADWGGFDALLSHIEQRLTQVGVVDADISELAHIAGHIAEQAEQKERAWRVYGLALRQWEAQGQEAAAAALRQKLQG